MGFTGCNEGSVPAAPDRRLPRRNRPDHRALVTNVHQEFSLVSSL